MAETIAAHFTFGYRLRIAFFTLVALLALLILRAALRASIRIVATLRDYTVILFLLFTGRPITLAMSALALAIFGTRHILATPVQNAVVFVRHLVLLSLGLTLAAEKKINFFSPSPPSIRPRLRDFCIHYLF